MTIGIPSHESLVRLLFAVGGVMTGVASTVAGSWISSKIHVYHENRKTHLEEIKQKVLSPMEYLLATEYAPLVTHGRPVVEEAWGARNRKENASVTEPQSEEGPLLVPVVPAVTGAANPTLYADAKKTHFAKLVNQVEQFLQAWRTHADECHAWVVHLAEDILTKSQMEPFPGASHGASYVNPYKLGLFVYRRMFRRSEHSLIKHSPDHPPTNWVLEGFLGRSAEGTKQQLEVLVSVLDDLIVKEKNTADRLQENARILERSLSLLRAELNYAIASRRLRKKCDLVTFF